MTFLKKILCLGFVISVCASSYASDNVIITNTGDPAFAIQQLQNQLNQLQAHVYTVLPLEAQESMAGDTRQDPETALQKFDENKSKAQLGSKLEDLRADIANLRGQLEEANHFMDMQAKKIDQLQQKVTTLIAQNTPPPPPPAPVMEPNAGMPAPENSAIITPMAVDTAAVPPAPVLTADDIIANEIKALDPKGALEKSKEYIRQGDYVKAETALKTFVESFQEDALVGPGYYYLGELYYIQKKFKEALSIFAEGYKAQPEGNKAPDSLLKMAQCFNALGQSKEACATLAKLLKGFKNLDSHLKSTAQKLKTSLHCPGKK